MGFERMLRKLQLGRWSLNFVSNFTLAELTALVILNVGNWFFGFPTWLLIDEKMQENYPTPADGVTAWSWPTRICLHSRTVQCCPFSKKHVPSPQSPLHLSPSITSINEAWSFPASCVALLLLTPLDKTCCHWLPPVPIPWKKSRKPSLISFELLILQK